VAHVGSYRVDGCSLVSQGPTANHQASESDASSKQLSASAAADTGRFQPRRFEARESNDTYIAELVLYYLSGVREPLSVSNVGICGANLYAQAFRIRRLKMTGSTQGRPQRAHRHLVSQIRTMPDSTTVAPRHRVQRHYAFAAHLHREFKITTPCSSLAVVTRRAGATVPDPLRCQGCFFRSSR
jgi:hypothetical protein